MELVLKQLMPFLHLLLFSSTREGKTKSANFELGILTNEDLNNSDEKNGTYVEFKPDQSIFKNYKYRLEYVEKMIKFYVYLNPGLTIKLNGNKFKSDSGLKDLIEDQSNSQDFLYPIIHLKGDDIEVAITHSRTQYSEEYYSFVNGQYTVQGGTHQTAFREAFVKTIREFFGKNYETSDIRKSIISAVSIKVMEPVFESQTKTKLGSTEMGKGLKSVRVFINDFVKENLIIIYIRMQKLLSLFRIK